MCTDLIKPDVRGWLVVVGGFLVHLSLGTIYTIGNMAPYFVSYIRAYSNPHIDYATGTWVFAVALIGQGSVMFVGGALMRKIGPRWTTLLGGLLMSCGIFLSFFTIKFNYYMLLLTYGFIFGAGVGIAYAPPMACAMKWLPNHKGLVNGIVVAGFGGGAFIFNQVQTAYINPQNKPPDQPAEPGSKEMYFSKENQSEILARVPTCFLILGVCYTALQVVGSLLLVDPPRQRRPDEITALLENEEVLHQDEQESESEEEVNENVPKIPAEDNGVEMTYSGEPGIPSLHPLRVIRTRAFWTLWSIFLVNGQSVTFISSLYKAYGQTFIGDDHFLGLVGAFSSVFNATGRIVWGRLVDKISFKVCMMSLCSMMVMWMVTLIATPYGGKAMFFIWICGIFGTFSGSFVLLPTATARAFGPKYVAVNYGLVFTSQVVTGPLGAFLSTQLLDVLHWGGMFGLVAGFSFTGLLLAVSFNVKDERGENI